MDNIKNGFVVPSVAQYVDIMAHEMMDYAKTESNPNISFCLYSEK